MPTVTLPAGMPAPMSRLPRDEVGRPVPFFVEWIDGKPDFRIMNPVNYRAAIEKRLCWVCGTRLRSTQRRLGKVEAIGVEPMWFVAGPMCLINRTSAEPPGHRECGEWSARACPFLSKPAKERREGGIDHDKAGTIGGIALMRNPGVAAVIGAREYRLEQVPNGLIVRFDKIVRVTWWAEGREATTDEVHESIRTGMPHLIKLAKDEGPDAEEALWEMYRAAERFIP